MNEKRKQKAQPSSRSGSGAGRADASPASRKRNAKPFTPGRIAKKARGGEKPPREHKTERPQLREEEGQPAFVLPVRPAGPSPIRKPFTTMQAEPWADYALLDMGHGKKLERYGAYTIVRPEPQAMGTPKLAPDIWAGADAQFSGDLEEEGPGRWRYLKLLPETWPMQWDDIAFEGRFTAFRHVGFFPEQSAHWAWMQNELRKAAKKRPPKVLNLFGYTGLASLVAVRAGAEVTHVDASKKAIGYARQNQKLAGLEDKPIRWIVDDAMKFVRREIRRGNTYDGILLDPPKFGRGPGGEVWQLFEHLPEMLDACRQILSQEALFLALTTYAMRASCAAFDELMIEVMTGSGGSVQSGELLIAEEGGQRKLATSLFSIWRALPEEQTGQGEGV